MFEYGTVTSVAEWRPLLTPEEPRGVAPMVLRAAWSDLLDGSLVQVVRLREAVVASMSPAARFELETGLPATTEDGFVPPVESEEAAVAAQARLLQLDRVARIADARRMCALLDSYEASMKDLQVRFGRAIGSRTGLGAQTFFRATGLALKQHPMQVAHLIDTALLAREWLPKTWQRFLAGGTTWRAIDLAVQQAEGLEPDRWAAFDEEAQRLVVESTRLKDALRKVRERLQDDTAPAPARARTTFQRRAAHLDEGADGSATFSLTGPAADLVAFDQALTKAAILAHGAEPDGEARTITQLRYDIARDLLLSGLIAAATPAPEGSAFQAAVPARRGIEVKLILTVPALAWLGHSTEQAILGGYGPIDLDTAKTLAGEATSMLRVLTDPVTGVRLTMDRTTYTPPPDLKRWIGIRDQHCRFPGCRRPAHLCDIDHAHEWHDHGVTDDTNLISLCRSHHNPKTAGLHQERLHHDGTIHWTDPWDTTTTDPPTDPMDPAPRWLLNDTTDDPDDPAPF